MATKVVEREGVKFHFFFVDAVPNSALLRSPGRISSTEPSLEAPREVMRIPGTKGVQTEHHVFKGKEPKENL